MALLVAFGLAPLIQADCVDALGVLTNHEGPGAISATNTQYGGCNYEQIPLQKRGSCVYKVGYNCDINSDVVVNGYRWWVPGAACTDPEAATPPSYAEDIPYDSAEEGPANGKCESDA